MSTPPTTESCTPSVRRSFHYDRTPSPVPSSAGSRSMQPLSDGIALLPWNRIENFGVLGPKKQGAGSKRKWHQSLTGATRLKSLLVVFLRSLRLVFLTAIGPWKITREQPKVAIYQQYLPAVLALSVHVIPLAAAVTMMLINLKTTIVERGISTTSLQYLAKALELLTQASISAAAFTYFRIIYTSGDGVPFGAITAGLQLSSLSYLWSLDLLGSLLSTSFQLRRKAVFAVFVLVSTLLTATVGPAIAACLIPRVQSIVLFRNEAYFPDAEDIMYPALIDAEHVSDICKSRNQSSVGNLICPFTGWEDLDQIMSGSDTTINEDREVAYGVRRLDFATNYRFSIALTKSMSLSSESIILKQMKNAARHWKLIPLMSTFLTAPSLRTLDRMNYGLLNTNVSEHHQRTIFWEEPSPIAMAFCQPLDYTRFEENNYTAFEYKNPFDPTSYLKVDIPSVLYDQDEGQDDDEDNDHTYQIYWSGSKTPGISVVAVLNKEGFILCPVIAGWVNSTQSAAFNQYPHTSDLSWSRDPVNISSEWAALLSPEFEDSGISVIDSLLSQTYDDSIEDGGISIYPSFSLILAGLVVNGMSSYAYNQSEVGWASPSWKHKTLSTKYHNTYSLYTEKLAYSTKGLAIQLSLAVLATYVAYTLAFIIYTLGFNRTASFAWDSISELTALALLSKPPEKSLENTRAGIETVELFKQQVHIRVVENEKLELVFKDEDIGRQTSEIEPNQKY